MCLHVLRPLIPGGPPSTIPAGAGAVPFPVLSPQNAPGVADIIISSTSHSSLSQTPPPQAGASPQSHLLLLDCCVRV